MKTIIISTYGGKKVKVEIDDVAFTKVYFIKKFDKFRHKDRIFRKGEPLKKATVLGIGLSYPKRNNNVSLWVLFDEDKDKGAVQINDLENFIIEEKEQQKVDLPCGDN